MQWTPYEVKRLEYQLRVDAANRCPGTCDPTPDSDDEENAPDAAIQDVPPFRRLAAGIATFLTQRIAARAH